MIVPARQTLITTLVNSVLYFLQSVFIITDGNRYRLVVYHNKEVLADQSYETLRGAKIAFSKIFQCKAFLNSKAEWSHLYPPEKEWLNKRLDGCTEYFPQKTSVVREAYAAQGAL